MKCSRIAFIAVAVLLPHLLHGAGHCPTEQSTSRYGIYGNLGLISHSADFRAFPGVPELLPEISKRGAARAGLRRAVRPADRLLFGCR